MKHLLFFIAKIFFCCYASEVRNFLNRKLQLPAGEIGNEMETLNSSHIVEKSSLGNWILTVNLRTNCFVSSVAFYTLNEQDSINLQVSLAMTSENSTVQCMGEWEYLNGGIWVKGCDLEGQFLIVENNNKDEHIELSQIVILEKKE